MCPERGRTIRLSPARRFVGDLLHVCRHTPLIPIERRMNLCDLALARESGHPRPGWAAIFTKAFASVAMRRPELRRLYMSRPTARIFEHPESIAAVIVEREIDGEPAVLPALLHRPEAQTIFEIDQWLKLCKTQPIEANGSFRRALRIARLPRPLRRALWRLGYCWWGRKRAKLIGTFGVSVTAGQGAATLAVRGPMTTILHYGLLESDGTIPVRLTFDHRVYDGATAARALVDLEVTLRTSILSELTAGERLAA